MLQLAKELFFIHRTDLTMAKTDFHKTGFDKGTKSKLGIFKEYFKESFPVFVHSRYFDEILIYDFFAGQGKNIQGEYGTALNILNEITSHCKDIKANKKRVFLILNDKEEYQILEENVKGYLKDCQSKCKEKCFLVDEKNIVIRSRNFEDYFKELYPRILNRKKSAKLIFLDPFNFVIDKELFNNLINLPSTDFICFMPSSFLRRFPEEPAFRKYIDTNEIDFKTAKPAHCHRAIADYFNTLIPENREYYIGCFSIKKGTNYYGLLFGSNHTLGAEKFQRVCWRKDTVTGEADYNIDRELVYNKSQGLLFEETKIPQKIQNFNDLLRQKILNKDLKTNVDVYKFALKQRCLIKHSSEVLSELMDEKRIDRFRTKNNDIHKIIEPISILVK